MGNVCLSVCLYSWKQNSRNVEVIFVHLLEWNSDFIQIPFGSSLVSNIFFFLWGKTAFESWPPWYLPCPVNLMWPRCSVCHYHLFHWGWQSWGRVSWCDFNLQHSPVHVVHHTCACPKQGDRLHFGDMKCVMDVSSCVAGRGPWCPGELWQFHQQETCIIFIHEPLLRKNECRWQKCHD